MKGKKKKVILMKEGEVIKKNEKRWGKLDEKTEGEGKKEGKRQEEWEKEEEKKYLQKLERK